MTVKAVKFEPALSRRGFAKRVAGMTMATGLVSGTVPKAAGAIGSGENGKPREILLASCWHDINIGDIAHTPGMLKLIDNYLPGVRVTLWPVPTVRPGYKRELTDSTKKWLLKNFPNLTVIQSGYDKPNAKPERPDQLAAIERADLLIVNSGGFHATPAKIWRATTKKPFGAYGVTIGSLTDFHKEASFLFGRDSPSSNRLTKADWNGVDVGFAPDATFALHLRDDERALAYMKKAGLEENKFICVIPRHRYSPYHTLYGYKPTEQDREVDKINAQFQSEDHAMLRTLITEWVKSTGHKVLACPEMTYGIKLAKAELYDPLPEAVRKHVVWRDQFWLPDEAGSVFARAVAVVSRDCHSPIISLTRGTPAIYLPLPTDNPYKRRMFGDIGLPQWIRDPDEIDAAKLSKMVLDIQENPGLAAENLSRAMDSVMATQKLTMERIREKHFG